MEQFFNIVFGIILSVVGIMAVLFVVALRKEIKKERAKEQAQKEQENAPPTPEMQIDVVICPKTYVPIYLLYNKEPWKFMFQATTDNDIFEYVKEKFAGMTVKVHVAGTVQVIKL